MKINKTPTGELMHEKQYDIPGDEEVIEILRALREAAPVLSSMPGESLFQVCCVLQVGLRNTPFDSPTRAAALESFIRMVAALERRAPGVQRLFDLGWDPDLDTIVTLKPFWDDEF